MLKTYQKSCVLLLQKYPQRGNSEQVAILP